MTLVRNVSYLPVIVPLSRDKTPPLAEEASNNLQLAITGHTHMGGLPFHSRRTDSGPVVGLVHNGRSLGKADYLRYLSQVKGWY